MKLLKLRSVAICMVAGVACAWSMRAPSAGAALKVGTTLENLQAAYNGECNAKARYEAFAVQADKDGYLKVATLFRAAAVSEGVHLAKHAKAIEKLGAKADAAMEVPIVKTTKENLETALAGETYEATVMYPDFVAQAVKDGNDTAKMTFMGALAAEKAHAAFYGEALKNMEQWKQGGAMFLVCSVCGYTTDDLTLRKCPICSAPRKDFKEIK